MFIVMDLNKICVLALPFSFPKKMFHKRFGFHAELVTILKDILYIRKMNKNDFVQCSDSKFALAASYTINNFLVTQEIVIEIINEALTSNKNIHFQWCSHTIKGLMDSLKVNFNW